LKKTLTAKQIKNLRLSLNMTQTEFSTFVGVSFPTISRWENGRVIPSNLAMKRLLEVKAES
jgi:DNA-binding transcriptional regulator YiaG